MRAHYSFAVLAGICALSGAALAQELDMSTFGAWAGPGPNARAIDATAGLNNTDRSRPNTGTLSFTGQTSGTTSVLLNPLSRSGIISNTYDMKGRSNIALDLSKAELTARFTGLQWTERAPFYVFNGTSYVQTDPSPIPVRPREFGFRNPTFTTSVFQGTYYNLNVTATNPGANPGITPSGIPIPAGTGTVSGIYNTNQQGRATSPGIGSIAGQFNGPAQSPTDTSGIWAARVHHDIPTGGPQQIITYGNFQALRH